MNVWEIKANNLTPIQRDIMTPFLRLRTHRLERTYPDLWIAVDGAIRDAVTCHPDIVISDARRSSVVKRIVGQVLALEGAGVVQPTDSRDG